METQILIIFHSLTISLFFLLAIFYFATLFSHQKTQVFQTPIFITGFTIYFKGTRKNHIYWKQSLPFFPQQLISIKTILNLLDKESKNFFLLFINYFQHSSKIQSKNKNFKTMNLIFNLNNQKIMGIFKMKIFDIKNQTLSGYFTNLESVKT